MIIKASKLKKRERDPEKRAFHGIYVMGDYDELASVMARYPSAVVTLETALSLHGITDDYLSNPFFLSFNLGYRVINDARIHQIWEDKSTRLIGTEEIERDGVKFLCYDEERLLLELFRREKFVGKEAFQTAIFHYRKSASEGTLNLPKLRKYCEALPKSNIYRERIRREIL